MNLHHNPSLFGLAGTLPTVNKGFTQNVQPLHEHLSGEGASKKSECVTLTEDMLGAFEMLKKACLKAPVLSFVDFNKPFLLETDTSKH